MKSKGQNQARTLRKTSSRSSKMLALTATAAFVLTGCGLVQSASYKMGYSDGQGASRMSVAELLLFTGGVCEDLATMAKSFSSVDNFSRSDYIKGCTDGFNSAAN